MDDIKTNGGAALIQIAQNSYSMTLFDPETKQRVCHGVFCLDDFNQLYWWNGKSKDQIEGDKVAKLDLR